MRIEGVDTLMAVGTRPMELVVFHEIRERNFEIVCTRLERAARNIIIKATNKGDTRQDQLPRWMRQRVKESALVYLACMTAASYLTLSYLFSFVDPLFSVDKWEEYR